MGQLSARHHARDEPRSALELAGERVVVVPMLSMRDAVELFEDALLPSAARSSSRTPIGMRSFRSASASMASHSPSSWRRAACVSLTVAEVLSRLDDRFRLLTRGRHGDVEHHRTLRATVDWSYQLLSDAERALFVRLSVFPGGFDLAAVEAVCADEMLDQVGRSSIWSTRWWRSRWSSPIDTGRDPLSAPRNPPPLRRERRPDHVDEAALQLPSSPALPDRRSACHTTSAPVAHQADGDATSSTRSGTTFRAAHSWALETEGRSSRQRPPRCDRPPRLPALPSRARGLGDITPRPWRGSRLTDSHGWVASWALLAGDARPGPGAGASGASTWPDAPDDPDATQCWVVVASVQLASGDSGARRRRQRTRWRQRRTARIRSARRGRCR